MWFALRLICARFLLMVHCLGIHAVESLISLSVGVFALCGGSKSREVRTLSQRLLASQNANAPNAVPIDKQQVREEGGEGGRGCMLMILDFFAFALPCKGHVPISPSCVSQWVPCHHHGCHVECHVTITCVILFACPLHPPHPPSLPATPGSAPPPHCAAAAAVWPVRPALRRLPALQGAAALEDVPGDREGQDGACYDMRGGKGEGDILISFHFCNAL